jgi:AcrR family transcriptional regulator
MSAVESELAAPAARKRPLQERSRARLEAILGAASELIGRAGSDQLKMSDVAARAGISIGSLYQYFPDKSALLRTLAERYNVASRSCIEAALADVTDLESLLAAFAALVDRYLEIVRGEPVMRDIWSGMQADKQLMALQLAESRIAGEFLATAMRRVHPRADAGAISTAAFLIWELGEASVRLAISVGEAEGRALVETYKRMSLREIASPVGVAA